MKQTIQIEIPEGKKAEWVDGVLALVDDKPLTTVEGPKVEFKFKVGDKVRNVVLPRLEYVVKERCYTKGKIIYTLESECGETIFSEEYLEFIPQDVTERIKTFEDAVKWCDKNKPQLVDQWQDYLNKEDDDVEAYLKLRIISAALNEGWEPTKDNPGWMPRWLESKYCNLGAATCHNHLGNYAIKLGLKSIELALYAKEQFTSFYADFCGCEDNDK